MGLVDVPPLDRAGGASGCGSLARHVPNGPAPGSLVHLSDVILAARSRASFLGVDARHAPPRVPRAGRHVRHLETEQSKHIGRPDFPQPRRSSVTATHGRCSRPTPGRSRPSAASCAVTSRRSSERPGETSGVVARGHLFRHRPCTPVHCPRSEAASLRGLRAPARTGLHVAHTASI